MKKRIVIFDLDGTLIKGQSQKLLIDILIKEEWLSIWVYINLIFWFLLYKIHFVKDTNKITQKAYLKFKNKPSYDLDMLIDKYSDKLLDQIYSKALTLVYKELKFSDVVVVMSASIEPVVKFYCTHFGVDMWFCTKLETDNGRFTGYTAGTRLYGIEKVKCVKDYLSDMKRDELEVVFYTDHHSDIDLLEYVDIPVCVNPDKLLRDKARANNWNCLNLK